jgi:DNA-binding IclR family transcriptional regulator
VFAAVRARKESSRAAARDIWDKLHSIGCRIVDSYHPEISCVAIALNSSQSAIGIAGPTSRLDPNRLCAIGKLAIKLLSAHPQNFAVRRH